MTVTDLCRISVKPQWFDSATIDLALPARMALGELMPSILDLVGGRPNSVHSGFAECYALTLLNGSVLEDSMTLEENGVRDGDLLLLTTEVPVVGTDFADVSQYVAAAVPAERDYAWSRRSGVIVWCWSAAIGATALGWPSNVSQSARAATAAIVAVTAAIAAIGAGRVDAQPTLTLSMGATAAAFGAVAGFLTVPGGPAPPNFFLAAVVCSAIAIVLLHTTCGGSTLLIAIAALSTMVAVTAAVATIWPMPATTLGAVLAAASLAALSVAAKMSVFLSGLSPHMPNAGHLPDDEAPVPAVVAAPRAKQGHDTLTGLLAGFSLAAAVGVVLVVADPQREAIVSRVVFAAVVSTVLAFRACQQHGSARQASVGLAGLFSATAIFLPVVEAPAYAAWSCLFAIALGAAALCLTHAALGARLSPLARRGLDVVEYLVLAAVVPLACWIGGLFGLVRGLSLI